MNHLLVVLNKTDMLPEAEREAKIEKMQKGLQKVFAGTKFKDPVMIPVSVSRMANILQHTVTHCNTLPQTATQCKTLQRTPELINLPHDRLRRPRWYTVTHCKTAALCSTLQHTIATATRSNTL